MHVWSELYAIDCWRIISLGNIGNVAKQQPWIIPNKLDLCGTSQQWTIAFFLCFTRQKWACSYMNFLIWGAKSEPRHLSFWTEDTPRVNHFIWVSLLGTRHKRTTSYEFLYLGSATSEPLHRSFFSWGCHKWTTSYEFLYWKHAASEPCRTWISLLGISKS